MFGIKLRVPTIGSIGKNLERSVQDAGNSLAALASPGGLNNIGSTFGQIGLSTLTAGQISAKDRTRLVGQSNTQRRASGIMETAKQMEEDKRSSLYNDALADNTLDAKTRQELADLYAGGTNSANIAATLSAARAGKGIYAVRKINQNQQTLAAAQPGRSQISNLGRGTSLI